MPLALAISPHLDDAAFSAGGALARLSAEGWRVRVATVFTASVPDPAGFALACQLDKGLGPAVDYMALRRREDEAACAVLGSEAVWLGLREAPHRGYGSAPELFGPVRADDSADRDVADRLRTLFGAAPPDLLLAPQAIGGHVDHVAVLRALESLPPACPVLLWRDFPYVSREASPAEPFRDRMAALPEAAVTLSPRDAERKREACLAYASQLGFQFGGPDGLRARLAADGGRESFRLGGAPGAVPSFFSVGVPA